MSLLKQNSDKDECTLNQDQCDRATTLCVNQIPHYTCECLDGYDRVNDLSCTGNHSFASLFSCEKELMCDSPFTLPDIEDFTEKIEGLLMLERKRFVSLIFVAPVVAVM